MCDRRLALLNIGRLSAVFIRDPRQQPREIGGPVAAFHVAQ
jgi:hypothetical protein